MIDGVLFEFYFMRLSRVGAATVALLFFYTNLIDFLDFLLFDFESLLDPYEFFDLHDPPSDLDRLLHESLLVLILSIVGDYKYKSLFGFVFYF